MHISSSCLPKKLARDLYVLRKSGIRSGVRAIFRKTRGVSVSRLVRNIMTSQHALAVKIHSVTQRAVLFVLGIVARFT